MRTSFIESVQCSNSFSIRRECNWWWLNWVPFNDITLTAQQHPLFYTVWWTPIPPSQLYVPASGHWQQGWHTKLMTWHQPMYTPSKLTPIYTSSNTKLYNGTCLYCAMVFDAWTFSMSSLENNKKWQQHCDRTNW